MSDLPSLRAQIEDRIAAAPRGGVWTPADFLDLGSRDAVDKALQRLIADDRLRRIERGLYDRPSRNALTRKPNPADPRQVIDAVARRDQIRVLVDGMTAANDLGLTNAVPAKIVVHTDARLKPIELGSMSISFKPTAASKLYWAGRPAMRLIQALHWLRDTLGDPNDRAALRARIGALLRTGPNAAALRADLADGMATLPTWMQDLLRPMIAQDPV